MFKFALRSTFLAYCKGYTHPWRSLGTPCRILHISNLWSFSGSFSKHDLRPVPNPSSATTGVSAETSPRNLQKWQMTARCLAGTQCLGT
eukprot:202359-Amorphochlora_amoeboformis.AAC.2